MINFCPGCGGELENPNAIACPKCGEAIGGSRTAMQAQKSEGLAAVLSFIWPGLGQIYNGQIGKGILYFIIMFIIALISVIFYFGADYIQLALWLIFSNSLYPQDITPLSNMVMFLLNVVLRVVAAYDAYITAGKINRG
jgi:TM2 domain-containing membrane protein YozV